jgi:Pectate lyase superfamily protein/SMP-30/Gluconolactonase/LRE-like region
MNQKPRPALLMLAALMMALPVYGASYYTLRLDDPQAVYLTRENFAELHGDGIGDDTAAIQRAIDKVAEAPLGKGIVFVPEGQYRLTKTIHIWPGIRVIGYGTHRPVFVLGRDTPGFQEGDHQYMVWFTGGRPTDDGTIRDANPGTFYSALANVDFDIKDGNPAAIGIRSCYAQHCHLAHIDFHIGSGMAGIGQVGNEAEDLHFYGGDYGIITATPSPSWPFTLLDSSFEGQRRAAIKTQEAGLTLVRNQFKNVPTAISINENRTEELWVKDSRFENISGPALIIGNENGLRTEINVENLVCEQVPTLVNFRESGKKIAGAGPIYVVKAFSHGLHIADLGSTPERKTVCETASLTAAPTPVPSDIPDLPPRDTWINLRALGAKGDGVADDTAVLQEAIAKHRAIYLPMGRYRVTDTIALKPDTVLIGMNPIATQILLQDATPAFQGVGTPKPLLETPKGGNNIVRGIGLDTGGNNSRAVAAKWMAGKDSMMDDVRFLGGHGTFNADGTRVQIYNNNHTADPGPKRRWDSQYYSLWITDGGGGTFKDIWTPSTFAQAGVYISDTATSGRIYEMSSEHHIRNEVKLRNVSNWEIYALQTEEERGEGPSTLPLDIDHSSNLTFANLHLFRIISTFPYAVKIHSSHNIRFRNVHVYSPSRLTFDNTVFDQTYNVEIRSHEIASLDISGNPPQPQPPHQSPVLASDAKIEKLVGGFNNIDGLVVDADGKIYFLDARRQSIYRWSPEDHDLTLVRDNPLEPVALSFDESGNLLVETRTRERYAFRPDSREDEITVLPRATRARGQRSSPDGPLSALRQIAENGEESIAVDTQGNTYVAAGQVFVYDPSGKQIDTIEVPERPSRLVFGGKNHQTLFIAARTSLYGVRTRFKGQPATSAAKATSTDPLSHSQ